MTKKDYIKLAQALKDSKPIKANWSSENDYIMAVCQWKNTLQHIAATLADDNNLFSHSRFYTACGMSESQQQ